MMNIKIGQKLVVGFVLVAMISLFVGLIAIMNLSKIGAADKELYEQATVPVSEIGQVATLFQNIRVESRDMIRANDGPTIEKHISNIEKILGQAAPLLDSFGKTMVSDGEKDVSKEFEAARQLYHKDLNLMTGLARQNRDNEAYGVMATTAKESCAAEQAAIDKAVKIKVEKARLLSANNARMAATARLIMVISILIGVTIAIFLGLMMARSITKPVNQVVAMIKDIAQGEGDLTKRLDIASKDEVGELALWFNTFVEKLHDIIYQVATATAQIASATQELASTAEQMAAGAEEQTSQTSQVATSMEEMSATVQEVAKNSGTAAGKAKSAGEVATKGGDVVAQTVQGMNKIADTVKELQQVVGGLSRNSEKIGNIVGVIDDVADQTNLLALNAAIEAARAGEQGRGFAVVADEVRKLAERTTASTKEIAAMVKNIQEDTGKAVGSMEVSAKEVGSGVNLANQAGTSLQEIVREAKGVQEMVQQIATAAEEQSAAAEEISSNVESIASVSKQNAAASEQTSAASQEISRLTDDLQSLVGKFKLNRQVEKKQAVAKAGHAAAPAASYPRQEKKAASFRKELDKGEHASA